MRPLAPSAAISVRRLRTISGITGALNPLIGSGFRFQTCRASGVRFAPHHRSRSRFPDLRLRVGASGWWLAVRFLFIWSILVRGFVQAADSPANEDPWATAFADLPAVEHHGDLAQVAQGVAASARYAELIEEKLTGKWFAALVALESERLNSIVGRFETRRGFFEFIENHGAVVDIWVYTADGRTEDGVFGRRLNAMELADLRQNSPDTPTFLTLTFRESDSGPIQRCRVEFGFQAAGEALVRNLAYQRSRQLQLTARQILSTRDENHRLNAPIQWDALERAFEDGSFPIKPLPPRPEGSANLFVAFEFAVDEDGNFSRVVRAYREDDIEREIFDGQVRLWLRRLGESTVSARAFRRIPLGDGLEPAPHPLTGREFVEIRIENPDEPDPRRWNVLDFGEPEVLQQLALARFGLINAHLEHRRKVLDLKRANLDMIFAPLFAGLNIGGGVSGVGFPIGAGAQLGYNVIAGPRFIPKVPTAEEMRELFLLLAARQRHPTLRLKPDAFLTPSDLDTLRADFSKLTEAQVRDTLEGLSDSDLKAMLALAKQANMDAKYTLLVNILSGAAVVSGQANSGAMRDLFNNPYFALNGDVYINYIIAAAVGAQYLTPNNGTSLYSLVRGEGMAKDWAQYIGVSFDIRALMNSVSRLRFRSLADKELRMPFPYASRMRDLAAYEVRIFGYPLLLFYKRGLLKDDLKAYNNDYAYGLIGRTIVVHFPTRESMEAEIRTGRMVPLGYVKVSDGKGGLRDSNLAVFAYTIPDGRHRRRIAMIIYGLKAYGEYSATIDREVRRFREYEKGLADGLVIEQLVEAEDAATLPVTAFEPQLFRGKTALHEKYGTLFAWLVEWRRHLQRHELGLPPVPEDVNTLEAVRSGLAALGVRTDEEGPDPLLGVDAENSSLRYVAYINGHRRVVQLTAITSLAGIGEELERVREGAAIEAARRDAVAPGGAGVAFLNSVVEHEGRLQVGPLVRGADGSVFGAGLRRTAAELEPVFAALDRLPVTNRARLEQQNYSGAVLDLDADGDGRSQRVAISLEFPLGEVRRLRTNSITGATEVEVYQRGRLHEIISSYLVVAVDRDDLGRETGTRTFLNLGSLAEPRKGPWLEQTRTLKSWTLAGASAWEEPYAARLQRLRLSRVTGDWTRETFGLFSSPVEVVSESLITTNQFGANGRLERAVAFANLAADDGRTRGPPTPVVRPVQGVVRFESTVGAFEPEGLLTLQRRDAVTGQRTVEKRNLARLGRLEFEESVDPFDGTREFVTRITHEYDDSFLFGQVPRRVVTTAASGQPLADLRILAVDPLVRQTRGVETDFTGATRTNLWSARWDRPVQIDTALRTTTNRFDVAGLEISGVTRTRDSGEEVARFAGRFDPSTREWVIQRDLWFQPGLTNRSEVTAFSPGGRVLRSQTAQVLETRPLYDPDGIARSNTVWFAETSPGTFERLAKIETDFRWTNGVRTARIQSFLGGSLRDEYRASTDAEGRIIEDGQRAWPGLSLVNRIRYDGGTERVQRAEEFQNERLRTTFVPQTVQPPTNGISLLPVQVTPAWGLVSTQFMVVGDPLGRSRETVLEDGGRIRTLEWFAGSAIARRTEAVGRDGRVTGRTELIPAAGNEGGIPFDRMIRRLVSPWNQESTVEEVALAQGSGVAVYAQA
ncbi:MAG TPA: hypothetical protein DCE44_07785, partial [Verrucomicrobiales bacterium]|nr:hypothetical protein [Verrucomicrobiales bacterium]